MPLASSLFPTPYSLLPTPCSLLPINPDICTSQVLELLYEKRGIKISTHL
ncbi:MAG: hypothetical protein F6K56_25285 [Moorea sp. SIO3G5]|nr:hypothetical protein [Moorena sp. SIO3G5]